jgi:hypothetical protein
VRRLAHVLLALALLAAWQAALLHPLEHVDSQGALVHVAERHSQGGSDPSPEPSSKLCDALAALTACAPDAPSTLGEASAVHETPVQVAGAPRAAQAPPFFAQGPPALL